MFLYTGISQLGDGMALYTGDSGDPVFRGWLKKSTPDYFSIVGQQEGSGAIACLPIYEQWF
jgi:hypothetical protein